MILACQRERSASIRMGDLCLEHSTSGTLDSGQTARKHFRRTSSALFHQMSLRGYGMRFKKKRANRVAEGSDRSAASVCRIDRKRFCYFSALQSLHCNGRNCSRVAMNFFEARPSRPQQARIAGRSGVFPHFPAPDVSAPGDGRRAKSAETADR